MKLISIIRRVENPYGSVKRRVIFSICPLCPYISPVIHLFLDHLQVISLHTKTFAAIKSGSSSRLLKDIIICSKTSLFDVFFNAFRSSNKA